MGQGGSRPKDGETHEVTIELEGEVSPEAFEEYLKQLRACLKELAKLADAGSKPLKVRIVRARIRRKK